MWPALLIIVLLAALLPIAVLGWQVITVIPLWIQARSSAANVSPINLIGARLRRLNPRTITEALIVARQAGLPLTFARLEAHALAGGNLDAVISASVSAHKAGIDTSFEQLAAIDLAGRDVQFAVNACVHPTTITCKGISGVAKDGIRIGARVQVTVRADLKRLVGGATTETVIARVGEGIVSAIGRAATHKEILENPDEISRYILGRGLDAGTAYEIVSVDVGDLDVLDNVGARLAEEKASADTLVAQARAEIRRAAAVATKREMIARTKGMSVKETEAKSEIPEAMAAAVRRGMLWRRGAPLSSPISRCLWISSDS